MPAVSSREFHNAMDDEPVRSARRRPHKAARQRRNDEFEQLLAKEPEAFKSTPEFQVLSGKSRVNLKSLNKSANKHKERIMNKSQQTPPFQQSEAAAAAQATSGKVSTEAPQAQQNTAAPENLETQASAQVVEEATAAQPEADQQAGQAPELEIPAAPKPLEKDLEETASIKNFPMKKELLSKDTTELVRRSLIVSLFIWLSNNKPGVVQTNDDGAFVLTGAVAGTAVGVSAMAVDPADGGVLLSVMTTDPVALQKLVSDIPGLDVSNLSVQQLLKVIEIFA